MTEFERFDLLWKMKQAHDTFKCYITGCLKCKEYYKILFAKTS